MGVRSSCEAFPVKVRTLAKALSIRFSIWFKVCDRSEISSFALGTGRRISRFRSLMRRASAASMATGLSALRLMKCPPAAASKNDNRSQQQQIGAEICEQNHRLIQGNARLH